MRAVHPDGLPELFLDRSLGRRQVPTLLRDVGLRLQTLAEVYGIPAEYTALRSPSSTILPWCMTATRADAWRTTDRSWAISR